MELFKSRDFSSFFSDTFDFVKFNGKHFFKHYLIINGIFLMVLMTFMYFFSKFYANLLTSSLYGGGQSEFETFIDNYGPIAIVLVILFFFFAIFAGLVSYSFTPIYFRLYEENSGPNFSTKEILASFKSKFGKLIIFVLVSVFLLSIPTIIATGIAVFIVMITIVGILLIPVVLAIPMLFFHSMLMEYIRGEKGIFDSMGYSFSVIGNKFVHAVGCLGILLFMSYIVQLGFGFVQSIFTGAGIYTMTPEAQMDVADSSAIMITVMVVTYAISFVVQTFCGLILQINQSLVFYTYKEETEHINTNSVIDQIGAGE
ncbi:hypothetical protein [Spongiivirga citrea]|uniref:Glycerophosphoryl diester phosphodiesterase membrane domain-containing protein n=1 Tax=Spongiivirga citrea TaxID=1481457 RepID=A0A6M0CJF8_9FLAO|nr:hypothetical protein [Spongiivirga citrea]NER16069.1 hypothetical protein [Spongiivirga citrea]